MLIRAIALSLAFLVGVGGIVIPFGTQTVDASPRKASKKRYKKYSKKWWRQYRARQKKRRAMIARKRALRLKQLRLARAEGQDLATAAKSLSKKPATKPTISAAASSAPRVRANAPAASGEMRFRVDDSAGWQVGNALVSVVGPAVGETSTQKHAKSVGGVSTSALRRDIINQMIKENGWVVNDYQKEIGGRSVYVVVAQSQAVNGRVQSRMFYFTEVDGRIYNVAANSPVEQQERLAEESEKVLDSLHVRIRNTERTATKD